MKFNWTTGPLYLVLTAESPDFDSVTIQNWKDEGYSVSYLPFVGSKKEYMQKLHHLADPLELGQKYAIVGLLLSLTLDYFEHRSGLTRHRSD